MRPRVIAGLALAVLSGVVAPTATPAGAAGNTHYVSKAPIGNDTSCASPGFNTIQAAVTASSPGNTINICPATYPEQVLVTKSLKLKGSGAGSTHVTYPASPVAATACADSSGIGLNAEPIFEVCGGTLKMSGLNVQGPYPVSNGCADQPQGVFVGNGSTLKLSSSTVTSIRQSDPGLFGCQGGVGLLIGRASIAQVGHAKLKNVTVADYQKGGVVTDGTGSTLKAAAVTAIGPGSPSDLSSAIAMNGIQVSRGASGSLSNVTVSGNECDAGPCGPDPVNNTQSAGILVFNPSSFSIKGSVINGNDIGIYNDEDSGSVTASITNNTLTDNRYEGILFDAGNAVAKSNRISGGNIGLSVIVYSGQGPNNPGGTFTSGKISGASVAGIKVDTDGSTATTPQLSVTFTDLSGNTGDGAVNKTDTPVDVSRDWWGAPSGPSDWSIGSGDSVSDNVDFFPWALTSGFAGFRTCDAGPASNIVDDNGSSGFSVLCGTGGNDIIQENGPNDVLILGNGGNDQLFGGGGNDSVIGGPGIDFLNGNAGSDHGQGRAGVDTCINFEFTSGC